MRIRRVLLLIIIIAVPAIIILGVFSFCQLNKVDQIKNLRWISSALIQAYIAVLALVPTISFALLSFSSTKYPTRLMKRLWKSRYMTFFFVILIPSIVICYSILASLSSILLLSVIRAYIILESLTIVCVILALYMLLEDIYESVGEQVEKVLSDLVEDIKTRNKTEEAFEDFFYVVASLAESRDLTSLRRAIENLFDLLIEDEEHYEIVDKIFFDIFEKYKKKNEYFCLDAVKRMIDKGYARIAELDNISLINKCLDQITGKESLKAFYMNQIKERKHVCDLNHKKAMVIFQKIMDCSENELREIESSEITLLDRMSSFMFEIWKFLDSNKTSSQEKNEFMKTLFDTLKRLVSRIEKIEIGVRNAEFDNFVNKIEYFQKNLDKNQHYYQEYISFLNWLENKFEEQQVENKEKNIIFILYRRLIKPKEV
jgi:hypothetical protein